MTASALLAGPPYERSMPILSFTVAGLPISQGSKSGFVNPRTGKVRMVESSKRLKPWRGTVGKAIREAIDAHEAPEGYPLLGPLAVDLVFTMHRPTSAPKTRRTWPTVYPDVDKLARAILDAGTNAGLWADDAQIVDLHAAKVYPSEAPGALPRPGVAATVYLIGATPPAPAEQLGLEVAT